MSVPFLNKGVKFNEYTINRKQLFTGCTEIYT